MKHLIVGGIIGIITIFLTELYGQTQKLKSEEKKEIVGVWGMYKDKHPDGWGTWNPPYEYLDLKNDGTYVRTYLNKKGNTLIFGNYTINYDSLIVFYNNIATNGILKSNFAADTARLHLVKEELEMWHNWDRIFSKKIKKWGHKKKFRPLSINEREKLEAITEKILEEYRLLKNENKKEN